MEARTFGAGPFVKTLVFFLEGRSEKVFLECFLPRAFPAINDREKFAKPIFITFEGKQNLQSELCRKIRGWRAPNSTFIVLQDQDSGNCDEAKKRLISLCKKAGKQEDSIVRIACRELENWYLGDLAAVGAVYDSSFEQYYNKSRFRHIDDLDGARELREMTGNEYDKIDGSRRIAQHISADYCQNSSHSFKVFCRSVEKLVQEQL